MIKLLINFFIIIFLLSCEEIKNKNISVKLNDSVKKIEKIVENQVISSKNKNKLETIRKNDNLFYYIGDPYYIQGVKYTPEENYEYSEIGLATFYGKELHNIKSVNNDINKVTELLGRHKTLPLPSMVKITNLDNGLSINIKIIDRHDDNASIVQVSRKVAQLLGFYKDKIATVRVDILSDASKQWKNVSMSLNEPEFNETIFSAPTEIVSISDIDETNSTKTNENNFQKSEPIELSSEEVNEYKLFLKIFNFDNYSKIQTIMQEINNNYNYTSEKNEEYYDLIIGPLNNSEINKLVSYFISKGYKETDIILN